MTTKTDTIIRALGDAMSKINAEYREKMFPKPKIAIQDKTKAILWDMWTENTGAHILDSGDMYGRGWEKARQNGFEAYEKEPIVKVEVFRKDDIVLTVSTWHFLNEYLKRTEFAERIEKIFYWWSQKGERENWPWWSCIEEFCEEVRRRGYYIHLSNTYNYDNLLDEVLQYGLIMKDDYFDGPGLIILQVHRGCDVRGGYTKPRIFEVHDVGCFLMAHHDIHALCSKCEKGWDSDDCGFHWYDAESGKGENPFIGDPENHKVYHKDCGGEIIFSTYWG